MTIFKEKYIKEVVPNMKKAFGYKNILAVPKIEKVIVNVGAGKALQDSKFLEKTISSVSFITGQKPLITKAKKSIAGFKLRKGLPIGVKVTLRGKRMEEFVYKLINAVIPRIRDFRGLSLKSFDKNGNYTIGFREQTVFPEVSGKNTDFIHGLEISVVTSAKSKKEAEKLLEFLGFPLKKEEENG